MKPAALKRNRFPLAVLCFGVVVSLIIRFEPAMRSVHDRHLRILVFTGVTSAILFLGAYLASPLHQLWPSRLSRRLRRSRRELGVACAGLQLIHALLLISMFLGNPDFLASKEGGDLATGTLAYLLLFAMGVTSFAGPRRWLGPKRWNLLHRVGLHYLWWGFTTTFLLVGTVAGAAIFGLAAMVRLLAALARLRAARKERKESP